MPLNKTYASPQETFIYVHGKPYKKVVILSDVNIPYKFTLDRGRNKLFFCINTDEYSDQSFNSVVLDLDTGVASNITGIRNGFASAVNQSTGTVYLGGSDGIYKYNYCSQDIKKPAVISGIDIFDMYYKDELYFVDTSSQNLYVYRNNKNILIPEVKDRYIKHFVWDNHGNLFFINSSGLYMLRKKGKAPVLCENLDMNFRGATTDAYGVPHFVAQNGIYAIDKESKQLLKLAAIPNCYGVAFDKHNHVVYSDERSVIKLVPCDK